MGWADQLEGFPASYFNSILLHSCYVWGGLGFFFTEKKKDFSLLLSQILQSLQCCWWTNHCREALQGALKPLQKAAFQCCHFCLTTKALICFPFSCVGRLLLTVSLRGVLSKYSFICLWQMPLGTQLFPTDISGVFALYSLLVGLVCNGIHSWGLRLILVDLSGEYDLSFIPWALDGICSYCQLGKERYGHPSLGCCTLKRPSSCLCHKPEENPCPSKGMLEPERLLSVQWLLGWSSYHISCSVVVTKCPVLLYEFSNNFSSVSRTFYISFPFCLLLRCHRHKSKVLPFKEFICSYHSLLISSFFP